MFCCIFSNETQIKQKLKRSKYFFMNYKLRIDKDISLSDLEKEVKQGSRFIVFEYCISLLLVITLRRYSPAILIHKNAPFSKYKKKYNILSSLFGWWGIPWGPFYTIKSFKVNRKGGIDVTEDIMLNISDESLKQREVALMVTNQLFVKPSQSNTKALYKALFKRFERDRNILQLMVGWFINTENDEAPYYVVGIKVERDFQAYVDPLKEAIYTQFRKHTFFDIIDLNQDEDFRKVFEKQGVLMINRLRITEDHNDETVSFSTKSQIEG